MENELKTFFKGWRSVDSNFYWWKRMSEFCTLRSWTDRMQKLPLHHIFSWRKIMCLSSFSLGRKKKQKTLFFSQAMSFLSYMSFLCSKKRFCLLLRCLVFSAICQNLTVNFWFYHLFSKNEKKEQLLKVQGMWIFFLLFISILKPFIPNPSLKIWQHTI